MFARRVSLSLFAALALLALTASSALGAPRSDGGRAIAVSAIASGGYEALPIAGAKVTVRSGGGLVGRAVTGHKGVALIWPGKRAPRTLTVTVSGGKAGGKRFGGSMRAVVHRYRWPDTVHVDSVTTLVARYLRAHPNASLARGEKLAKRFLKLPRGYAIGPGGRGNAEFDGRRYLAAAQAAGGYDRFSRRMARQLGKRKARRSFAHDAPPRIGVKWAQVAAVGAEPGADIEEVAGAVSKGVGFFDVLTKTTQVLQFVNVVKELAGVGSNQATKAEIEAIDVQLQQIEQSLSVIERGEEEIRHEAKVNLYSVLAVLQDENAAAVQSSEETLHTTVLLAAEHGCSSAEETPSPACQVVQERLVAKGGWVDKLDETLVEKPARLNAYAQAIGGEAIPGPTASGQQGLVQVASEVTTTNPGQGFYTSEQSARAVSVAAGWIISYAEALVMAPAYWSLTGVSAETIAEDVKQMSPYAAAMPPVMPTPVADGTSLELANGQLWAVDAAAEGSQPWSWFLENNLFEYDAASNQWASSSHPGQSTGAITSENTPAIPYADWLVVGAPQLAQLLAAATPRGSQLAGEALLEQAGFSNWLLPKGNENVVGLELEYEVAAEDAVGCAWRGASHCFWPVWVENGVVGNMHFSSAQYGYRQGWFETDKFLDIEWAGQKLYGYDNEGTIYGPIAPSRIPVLFFRPVGGECFYYASLNPLPAGASGCPR